MTLFLFLSPFIALLSVFGPANSKMTLENMKQLALTLSSLCLSSSLIILITSDFSTNQFLFVKDLDDVKHFNFYLGVDGLSLYFIILTSLIVPVSLVSNWNSIVKDVKAYVFVIVMLEVLLLTVFFVLDGLMFYIFFESILPPLFILIGIFGSDNRVKASFYLFLYTLLGSLFLLLSLVSMSSIFSTTDYDTLFKGNFLYLTQLFLFYGVFIAFAVKTPTIFLNTWLLKAHVESPLGGSIILAAIVLKLSLYGILRIILPILSKAFMEYTFVIFVIGVITILYASLSTIRTIDVKELIAYSSVSHAAVYLLGVFSNTIQGIVGAINLGLAHGLVSPGLFICAGGVLYDRCSTRVISFYRGVTQVMPLFAILFLLLCLANCGAPLSLNFIGEFLSLYGVFERSSLFGVFASSSIIFSAAYTMYMYQRIAFGGVYSKMFVQSIPDLTKREFTILMILVVPTILLGIYPAPILDVMHYSVSTLIYSYDDSIISCDASTASVLYFQDSASPFALTTSAVLFFHGFAFGEYNLLLGLTVFILSMLFWGRDVYQFFNDYLRILKDKCSWTLDNPPKPHSFPSLLLESSSLGGPGNGDSSKDDDNNPEGVDDSSSESDPENQEPANDGPNNDESKVENAFKGLDKFIDDLPSASEIVKNAGGKKSVIEEEHKKALDKVEEHNQNIGDKIFDSVSAPGANVDTVDAPESEDSREAAVKNAKEQVNECYQGAMDLWEDQLDAQDGKLATSDDEDKERGSDEEMSSDSENSSGSDTEMGDAPASNSENKSDSDSENKSDSEKPSDPDVEMGDTENSLLPLLFLPEISILRIVFIIHYLNKIGLLSTVYYLFISHFHKNRK